MKKQTKIVEKDGEKAIKVSVSTIIYSFLILLVAVIGIGSILAYGTSTQIGQNIAAKIAKVVPYPAAIVSWNHVVLFNDMENNLDSVLQFYKTQNFSNEGLRVDFTTPIGQKRLEIKKREILDKMVEDQIVETLAKQRGINISSSDVNDAVTAKLNEYGTGDDVKADLLKSYGWDMNDFKQKVVLPSMYTEALSQSVMAQNQGDTQQAKIKIQQAQAELNSGADFAQVASKYSEGLSKENGGELGWVRKDQVVPELGVALFGDVQPDNNSIIESSIGFHIVDIENQKQENGAEVLQLRQIFVAKNTFADWLQQQKEQMNVWIPMSEFVWDKKTGTVDFRDPQMQKFEQDERSTTQGDASLMF